MLNERILKLFYLKFKDFTKIQKIAIPTILSKNNTLIVAPTGSGKTESALLPVLHKILKIKEKHPNIKGILSLYITPLRALNRDLLDRIQWWCKKLDISVAVRHGDTPQSERARQSKKPPELLITTPETLQILFMGKKLRESLKSIKFVIIDELHELLNDKRGVQLSLGLERLVNLCGEFQRIVLSATIGDLDLAAKFIFGNREYTIAYWYSGKKYEINVLRPQIDKNIIELSKKLGWSPKIVWSLVKIKEILDSYESGIIYVNTREMAELLVSRFKKWLKDYQIEIHHSSLSREVRERNERLLKQKKLKAIVATSSLELGIDIGHVDVVIQYTSPRQAIRLLQRCLTENMQILTPYGYLPIKEIFEKKIDRVYSYNLKEKRVEEAKIIKYHKYQDNKIYRIYLACGEILEVTADHPILTDNGWILAKDLKEGMYVAEFLGFDTGRDPLIKNFLNNNWYVLIDKEKILELTNKLKEKYKSLVIACKKLNINYWNLIDKRRSEKNKFIKWETLKKILKRLNKDVEVLKIKTTIGSTSICTNILKDPRFYWFLGLIAANGNLKEREKSYAIRVAFAKDSKYQNLIEKLSKFLSDYRIKWNMKKISKNTNQVEIYNKTLMELIKQFRILDGRKAGKINLTNKLLTLSNKYLLYFTKGFLDGSGRADKVIRFFTTSKNLALQLHYILNRLGFKNRIYKQRVKTSKLVRKINYPFTYIVSIYSKEDVVEFVRKVKEIKKSIKNPYWDVTKKNEKLIYIPIKNIEVIKEEKEVYNVTLNDYNILIVGNILTHNCGRAGHKIGEVSKGYIITMDVDDYAESLAIKKAILQ